MTTLAGSGYWAFANGQGTAASFNSPRGLAVDKQGNVYVGDTYNHLIRKITPDGNVTTLAGSGFTEQNGSGGYLEGSGPNARFNSPRGLAVDAGGNVYVVDHLNNRIRKISANGTVSLIAGSGVYGFANGQGSAARLAWPTALALDADGTIYVGDNNNNRIRKISASGNVTTLAGNGSIGFANGNATAALFSNPSGLALDSAKNVYVADTNNHRIRKISASGNVTTLAGSGSAAFADGNGTAASFNTPTYVAVDGAGMVYVADSGNHRIRKITADGTVTTLAGSGVAAFADGNGTAASFNFPRGLALDGNGYLYVADSNNNKIRKVSLVSRLCSLTGNLSFGTLTINQTANRMLSIRNTGAGNLTVAGITYPSGFSGNWSGKIAPGATQNVTVSFRPLAQQTYEGNLTVNCDSTSGGTNLALSGAGVPLPPVITSSTSANGMVGAAFSYQITATNNPTSYESTTLPSGLNLNATTGLISGTPTIKGNSSVTLRASNAGGTGNATLAIAIADTRIIGLSGNLAYGTAFVNQSTQRILAITNTGTGNLTVNSISYPSGFSGNWSGSIAPSATQNVAVTFAPAAVRNYGGNVVVNSNASSGNATISSSGTGIALTRIVALSGNLSFGNATVNQTTTRTYSITNTGNGNLTVTGITCPSGFSGNWSGSIAPGGTQNVTVSFTPTIVQNYSGNLMVNSNATSGGATLPVTGRGVPPPPVITSGASANGTVGVAFSYQITASNNPTSYGATGLPAGLSLNATTGLISGTPSVAGNASVTLSATNAGGTGNATLALAISPSRIIGLTGNLAFGNATVGQTANRTLSIRNTGTGNLTVTGITCPSGFSGNFSGTIAPGATQNVTVSFTPTASQSYTGNLSVNSDATSGVSSFALSGVGVPPPPVITNGASANGTVGVAFSYQITASNNPASYGATGLPQGLSLNATTGLISGTPSAAGNSSVNLTATNAGGTGNATLAVAISHSRIIGLGGDLAFGNATVNTTTNRTLSITNTGSGNLTVNSISYTAGFSGNWSGTIAPGATQDVTVSFRPDSEGAFGGNLTVNSNATAGTSTIALSGTGVHSRIIGLTGNLSFGNAIIDETANRTLSITNTGTGNLTINSISCPSGFSGNFSGTIAPGATQNVTVSFTPTAAQGYSGNLSVNSNATSGVSSLGLSGTGVPPAPVITSATSANGTVGVAFSYQITASNNATSYGATGLPGGLSVNATTGLISGMPTGSGNSSVNLSATNAGGTGNATLAIAIADTRIIGLSGNLAFGNATVNQTATRTLSITNTGTGDLTINSISYPSGFSGNFAGTIAPGATQNVTVSFTPTAVQSYSGNLSVNSNATSGVSSLGLSGTGVPPAPVITSATSANGTVGVAFSYQIAASNNPTSYGATGLPQGLSLNATTGLISGTPSVAGNASVNLSATNAGGTGNATLVLSISPSRIIGLTGNLAFGNTTETQSSQRILAITNTGSGNLTVTGIVYPSGFSGNWSGSIAPGATQNVTISFSPTTVQSYGGNVVVNSNASSGSGTIPCSGNGIALTRIISLSGNLSFGNVPVNQAATRTLSITNTGSGNLTISSISYPSGFTIDWAFGGVIAPGSTQDVTVSLTPTTAQSYSGNVTIDSDASSGSNEMFCTGNGIFSLIVNVTTLAGSGIADFADGQGQAASFNQPWGVAVDGIGNVYVADSGNNRIRKIDVGGNVTTLAGSGNRGYADGEGPAAFFNNPRGVAVDGSGNAYVADTFNSGIRKIDLSGNVTTLAGVIDGIGDADGFSTLATFYYPFGVAVDINGNIYVADTNNNLIRKILPSGLVTTLAGSGIADFADGQGQAASFNQPLGVAVDGNGNVYVADNCNNRIRKIDAGGNVTTISGSGSYGSVNGQGTAASFSEPSGIAVDQSGNLYVSDPMNNLIRKITPDGDVTTLAGSGSSGNADGEGPAASFGYPCGLAIDGRGNIYVADSGNNRIRKITIGPKISINGTIPNAIFNQAYEFTFGVTGASAPVTWSISQGTLPPGMSLNATSGVLSGTPTHSGNSTFTVRLDSGGYSDEMEVQLRVEGPGPIMELRGNPGSEIYFGSSIRPDLSEVLYGSFTISNTGSEKLIVNLGDWRQWQSNNPPSGWSWPMNWALTSGLSFTSPTGAVEIEPGREQIVSVSYESYSDPSAGGAGYGAMGYLTLVSNAANSPVGIPYSFEVLYPRIEITGSLDFGDVVVGETAQREITITNTGAGYLRGNVGIYGNFGFSSQEFSVTDSVELYSGQSKNVTVTFRPISNHLFNGYIYVSQLGNGNIWNYSSCSGNGVLAGPLDSDGDGVSDYREQQDGTDPNNSASFNSLSNGLVAYYPFNGNANDESGYQRDGVNNGATLSQDRIFQDGQSFYFNGENYITIPNSIGTSETGSVALWFKSQSWSPGNFGQYLFSATAGDALSNYGIGQGAGGGDWINLGLHPNETGLNALLFGMCPPTGWIWANSGSTPPTHEWNQVVGTWDGSKITIYLNGIKKGEVSKGPVDLLENLKLHIGASSWTDTGFEGNIDDVRIYNRALSAAEVSQLYSEESGEPNMVLVQGGTLPTGSALANQTVSAFHIARFETTWAEWKEVRAWAAANGYDIGNVGQGSADNHPVHSVSWYDAVKWCNAKSEMEGLTPVYTLNGTTYKAGQSDPLQSSYANGYRLPAEAEWEWAALGGVSSNGYTYSGSNDLNAVGWYNGNSGGGTKAIGTKVANELGVFDMTGNVAEWCWGTSRPRTSPRGGSCLDDPIGIFTPGSLYPETRALQFGFRYARSAIGDMVTVQGGTLPQSSELAGETVQTFEIARTEVTWGEWKSVRDWALANGYGDLAGVGTTHPAGSADNFPVVSLRWYDVIKWSNAKSEMEGLTPVYSVNGTIYRSGAFGPNGSSAVVLNSSANGYRLPAEREWEWAARGGVASQGYIFSGANNSETVGWYYTNSNWETRAVGLKTPNELGFFDMSGNVREWCWEAANPSNRILRGGSCCDSDYRTVANRDDISLPDYINGTIGLRLARNLGPKIVINGTIPNATLNQPYAGFTFNSTATTGPVTWSANGTLPPGMSFNATTANISGTPTAAGNYTFTLRLDSGGYWDEVDVVFTISLPPSNGTVVAWGGNNFGQTDVPAGLSGVTAIAAAWSHAVALKNDGTVVAWGGNGYGYGQTNVPAGLSGVTAIAAGGYLTVALKNDGTVVAWEENVPAGLGGVTAIAAGEYHTVVLKNDGTVVAWGNNFRGQTDVPAGLSGVTAIAAGEYHTVALKNDGTVVEWGSINAGQTNVPAGLSGVTAIAAGGYHTVALKNDGTVVAWGWNDYGQTNVPAGLSGVTAIAAGGYYTVALRNDGPPVAPAITSFTSANGVVGSAFSYQITARNNATSYGATGLPQGLSLNATTGLISGMPTAAGNFSVNLTATNAGGTRNATLSMVIFPAPVVTVTTLAGSGNYAFADGQGTLASFKTPYGVAGDGLGNLYVADNGNYRIRKINPGGDVEVFAGSGLLGSADGLGQSASFNFSTGIAVDKFGNSYLADNWNHKIRKITPDGNVTTLAGSGSAGFSNGQGASSSFYYPSGVAVDDGGNVYVVEFGSHRIRKITSNGNVTTFAGSSTAGYADGNAAVAEFRNPCSVAVDGFGNVYVADTGNHKIRKISAIGNVMTLAGSGIQGSLDGPGTLASFNSPWGLALDETGNVYVADAGNHKIRKISPDGNVTTIAGSGFASYADGNGTSASFNNPYGVAVDGSGNVYIADSGNHRIRKIAIGPKISITGTMPDATLNRAYASFSFNPTGTNAPVTWAISGGTLPPGMSFNATTATLTGTPTATGTYTFIVRLDSGGYSDEVEVVLKVLEDFAGTNYSNSNLAWQDLSYSNFTGSNFLNANLQGSNLQNSNLTNANMDGTGLFGINFAQANLAGATFQGARFDRNAVWPTGFSPVGTGMWGPKLDYSGQNLSGKNFAWYDFMEGNFTGANLATTNFQGAGLEKANFSSANMSGAGLHGANLSEATLTGVTLTNATFSRGTVWPVGYVTAGKGMWGPKLDYSGQNLSGKNFAWYDFLEANFTGANLTTTNFRGAGLDKANFSSANMSGAELRDASLTEAILTGVTLTNATFSRGTVWPVGYVTAGKGMWGPKLDYSEQNLSGKNFAWYDFMEGNFTGANLTTTNFRGAGLDKANFSGANMSGAELRDASLTEAILTGATLTNAMFTRGTVWPVGYVTAGKGMWGPKLDYSGQNLSGKGFGWYDFMEANFTSANLQSVDFRGANLDKANFTNADMRQASFRDADLTGAVLTGVNLTGARYTAGTKWPDGFSPSGKGMTLEP